MNRLFFLLVGLALFGAGIARGEQEPVYSPPPPSIEESARQLSGRILPDCTPELWRQIQQDMHDLLTQPTPERIEEYKKGPRCRSTAGGTPQPEAKQAPQPDGQQTLQNNSKPFVHLVPKQYPPRKEYPYWHNADPALGEEPKMVPDTTAAIPSLEDLQKEEQFYLQLSPRTKSQEDRLYDLQFLNRMLEKEAAEAAKQQHAVPQ
jgi:hypothetical protein